MMTKVLMHLQILDKKQLAQDVHPQVTLPLPLSPVRITKNLFEDDENFIYTSY